MQTLDVKKRNRAYWLLIIATFVLYIVLTGAKNLYVAEKTTLQSLGTFGSFTDLALTMEYYFYAYAVMQVLLVMVMKRINVKWFLTVTLSISAVITVMMAFTSGIVSHWVLYTVNGAVQAGVWGCSIKTLSTHLPKRLLSVANKMMTSGPAVAGVISYAAAAIFGNNWTTPFIVLGALLLACVLVFFFSVSNAQRYPREQEVEKESVASGGSFVKLGTKKRRFAFYAIAVVISIFVTSLFFAVNNTLDIFLKQIGGFSNTASKWITVFAPVAFIIGPVLCVNACERHDDFIAVGTVFLCTALGLSVLLLLFFEVSVVLSMVLLLGYLIMTNGARSLLLSIVALKLRDEIDAGVFSTVTNAAASVAAGTIPRLFTSILDNSAHTAAQNWASAFTAVAVVCAATVVILVFLMIALKTLRKRGDKKETK